MKLDIGEPSKQKRERIMCDIENEMNCSKIDACDNSDDILYEEY